MSAAVSTKELDCYEQLVQEAKAVLDDEPELKNLLEATVLHPRVDSFPSAVASTMVYRLLGPQTTMTDTIGTSSTSATTTTSSGARSHPLAQQPAPVDATTLFEIFNDVYTSGMACTTEDCYHYHLHQYQKQQQIAEEEEQATAASTLTPIRQILILDVLCVMDRDPAMDTMLEVILFAKGFASLACHRVSNQRWQRKQQQMTTTGRKSFFSLWLQSTVSAVFGVDIHPAATIGSAVMFDHATGIVVGETAVIGSGSTLLHSVTLGGTGKASGVNRHPKIGRHVLIGAGAKILGNIQIGEAAKIGAGSVVLRPIPAGATAVGAPAKIIGHKMEDDPAETNDQTLSQVSALHKSVSDATLGDLEPDDKDTSSSSVSSDEDTGLDKVTGGDLNHLCPYRNYSLLAFKAPKGTVTILSLMKYLIPLGLKSCAVGPIMFELDQRNVGYVHTSEFEDRGKDCISRLTKLPSKDVDFVYDHILADANTQKLAQASKKLRLT